MTRGDNYVDTHRLRERLRGVAFTSIENSTRQDLLDIDRLFSQPTRVALTTWGGVGDAEVIAAFLALSSGSRVAALDPADNSERLFRGRLAKAATSFANVFASRRA